jgi:transcription factor SPT20
MPAAMEPLPLVKSEQAILKRHQKSSPSFIVHLYPNHFRLHQINENFTYDSPMADLIKHIKNREIPHDFLEALTESNVPWYDGRYSYLLLKGLSLTSQ